MSTPLEADSIGMYVPTMDELKDHEFKSLLLYTFKDITFTDQFLMSTSGRSTVGQAVAPETRHLRFKSSHQHYFIYCLLCCKDENKEKEAVNNLIFKEKFH